MDRTGVTPRGKSIQIDFYYQRKRCRETLKILPTKANIKHAQNKRAAILHEIEIGTFNYARHFPNSKNATLGNNLSTITIEKALNTFLKTNKRRLEYSTYKDYNSIIEFHLKPQFGNLRLIDLTTTHIHEWIGSLDISNKRINNILIPLRTIYNDAYADGVIDRNPLSRIKNLTVRRQQEIHPFTPQEISSILKVLPQQGKNLIQFAVWTGLRTSELLALEWDDVDWIKNQVRVRRALVKKHIKPPKTKAGERDVKLFPPALEALINQKQFTFLANGRVFNNPRTNTPWETDEQIRKTMWVHALKKAGVLYRVPYQTRHTYASTLLSAGENPLWVAQQMGHKDWGMIRKTYGRWIPDVDTSAGSKVMDYFNNQLEVKDAKSRGL